MVIENDLLKIALKLVNRIGQVRQKQIQASMTAHPSPLLTTDDVLHVTKVL